MLRFDRTAKDKLDIYIEDGTVKAVRIMFKVGLLAAGKETIPNLGSRSLIFFCQIWQHTISKLSFVDIFGKIADLKIAHGFVGGHHPCLHPDDESKGEV